MEEPFYPLSRVNNLQRIPDPWGIRFSGTQPAGSGGRGTAHDRHSVTRQLVTLSRIE